MPGDRRGAYAAITATGIEQLRAMWPVYARVVGEHFASSVRDPQALEEQLVRVADSARGG
ncbi:MAG: hypothetical protein ACRDLY_07120 [Thermoleophilaceae bacterium]